MALWQINPPSNYLWPSSIIIFKRHHLHCMKWSFSCQKIWYFVSVFQKVRQFVLVTFLITSLFSFNGTGNDFPWKKSFPQTCRLQRKLSNVLKIIRLNQIYDSIMIPPAHKGQNDGCQMPIPVMLVIPMVGRCQFIFKRDLHNSYFLQCSPRHVRKSLLCGNNYFLGRLKQKGVFCFVLVSHPPQSQHSLSSINKERHGTSFTITML